jgi:hypothetical protein
MIQQAWLGFKEREDEIKRICFKMFYKNVRAVKY